MFKKKIGSIPQIVRPLVNHLPEKMDHELKNLIAEAEKGKDTTIEIVELFAKYEMAHGWMEEQITSLGRADRAQGGYSGAAGDPVFVPPSQKWVCPKNERDHWMMVIQEGEDAPTCKIHKIEMVRGSQ
jgi:hypothetical protein